MSSGGFRTQQLSEEVFRRDKNRQNLIKNPIKIQQVFLDRKNSSEVD